MTSPSPSLSSEPLSRDECLRLLDQADVARVLLSLGALPAALPARIELMEEDHLLISSRENAVLLAARRGDVISVQIDGLDPNDHNLVGHGHRNRRRGLPDGTESKRFKRTTDGGATLVTLPLSIVIGQREH